MEGHVYSKCSRPEAKTLCKQKRCAHAKKRGQKHAKPRCKAHNAVRSNWKEELDVNGIKKGIDQLDDIVDLKDDNQKKRRR